MRPPLRMYAGPVLDLRHAARVRGERPRLSASSSGLQTVSALSGIVSTYSHPFLGTTPNFRNDG
nr:MAG TPA: hypothetical protein [Bacteriophage sp.]